MANLEVPQGRFELNRYPEQFDSPLRPWDAADEFLLAHLAEAEGSGAESAWLVLNDSFGALAVALARQRPVAMSDSYLSQCGTRSNLDRNGMNAENVTLSSSLAPPPDRVDVLVMKVPKTLALLEDQLHRVRPSLHAETLIVGAGMTRHIHTSTLELIEGVLGPTSTSRARKKARLIFVDFDVALDPGPNPYPTSYQLPSGATLLNHANVFSRRRLDMGTRLLLEHLPTDIGDGRVVDVGCGNGVIGVSMATANPDALVTMIDESFMAVASATANATGRFGADHDVEIRVGDSLTGIDDASVDLVISNPPFHDDHAVGDVVAWEVFKGAHRVLKPGGRLLVVGNRHLGYHAKVRRIFGDSEVVASNPKFVVTTATR
jgi:23S rRNA (guanine1835-N2)-methyltransferase